MRLPILVPALPIECWVDGSFSFPAKGGFAFVIKACTTLLRFGASASRAFSAYHMEALAFLTGIRSVLELNHQTGCFYTDSQVLLKSISSPKLPVTEDWRAYSEIVTTYHVIHLFFILMVY